MSANSKPFFFILTAFITVLLLSFLGNTFSVLGVQFKNINIISDLIPGSAAEDTLTAAIPGTFKDSTTKALPDYRTSDEIIGYEGNAPLQAFIKALQDLSSGKRKKVRIAYFGDSMIEGDLLTQDLRKLLQDYFGGRGVGFVPVTSIVAGFRQSVSHSFSQNWNENTFLNRQGLKGSGLFISGHAFRPSENSSVHYSAVNYARLDNFDECYLLYGKTDSTAHFTLNDSVYSFTGNAMFNSQFVAANQHSIKASFSGSGNTIYGFSFESSHGVFLDNLAFRGISGMELQSIPEPMLQSINQSHPYDLIVVQYGPNLLFKPELIDFKWYSKPMETAIAALKQAFPQTSILVVGTADKSVRYDGEYRTQKGVIPLTEVQNRIAHETQTNFWSLYNAMGGRNSMIRWVNSTPPLANVDYTHLTHKGATQVARILFDKLMQVYDPEAASRSQIQPVARYVNVSRGL